MEQTVCLKSNHLNLKAFSLPVADGEEGAVESSFKWKGREKGFCTEMFDATQGVGGGLFHPVCTCCDHFIYLCIWAGKFSRYSD